MQTPQLWILPSDFLPWSPKTQLALKKVMGLVIDASGLPLSKPASSLRATAAWMCSQAHPLHLWTRLPAALDDSGVVS